MRYLFLTLTLMAACGEPEGPVGICYRMDTFEDGRPVEPTVLWRECLPDSELHGDGTGECHVQRPFSGRDEIYPESMTETEEECYR